MELAGNIIQQAVIHLASTNQTVTLQFFTQNWESSMLARSFTVIPVSHLIIYIMFIDKKYLIDSFSNLWIMEIALKVFVTIGPCRVTLRA